MKKIVFLLFFVVFLVSYFQVALYVQFSVLTIERSSRFSFASFFEGGDDGVLNLDLAGTDVSTLFEDSDLTSVLVRVGVSVFAYFLAFGLVLVVFGLVWVGRFRRGCLLLVAFALGLHILAGWLILTVPPLVNGILDATVQRILGFFALFIDVGDMVSLSLGWGYWMTVVVMGLLFFMLIIKERGFYGGQ